MTEIDNFTNDNLYNTSKNTPTGIQSPLKVAKRPELLTGNKNRGAGLAQTQSTRHRARNSTSLTSKLVGGEYEPISPAHFLRQNDYEDLGTNYIVDKSPSEIDAKIERSMQAIEQELLSIKVRGKGGKEEPLLLRILERKDPAEILRQKKINKTMKRTSLQKAFNNDDQDDNADMVQCLEGAFKTNSSAQRAMDRHMDLISTMNKSDAISHCEKHQKKSLSQIREIILAIVINQK